MIIQTPINIEYFIITFKLFALINCENPDMLIKYILYYINNTKFIYKQYSKFYLPTEVLVLR